MRRRLDLAASLVGRPRVIFLDEPTTGLDPAKRQDMWDVLRRLVTDGSTVLLTTQYLEEADALADEISVIDHGKVIAHDTPDGLKRKIGGQRDQGQTHRLGTGWTTSTASSPRSAATTPQSPDVTNSTVAVNGEDALAATVGRLAADGISVTELSLHLPSLDEVFMTLTGERVGADGTATDKEVAA